MRLSVQSNVSSHQLVPAASCARRAGCKRVRQRRLIRHAPRVGDRTCSARPPRPPARHRPRTSSSSGSASTTDEQRGRSTIRREHPGQRRHHRGTRRRHRIGAKRSSTSYWATHWSDYFTGTYQPPTVHGLYDGTDPADDPDLRR